MLVAPADEIAARERLEMESNTQSEKLSPLRSEFVQVNYAKAADMLTLINGPSKLLSDRGSASVDSRTNTLIILDTAKRIEDILSTIRLSARKHDLAAGLSHGQKQWLEIGMLLAQDPKLLLVDEPVAGMTDAETEETARLLKDIARDHSVIVVEHDMHFVRELGVKATCLHEGSVLSEGTLDFVSADERVVEVYLGR